MKLRPAVQAFAEAMEQRLQENEHKKGWDRCGINDLMPMLLHNLGHLVEAHDSVENSLPHAADAANYVMMIADIEGDLDYDEDDSLPEGTPSDKP